MFDLITSSRALIASASVLALLAGPVAGDPAPATLETPKGVVNVNTASLDSLQLLWRTGPATAKAIVSGRPYDTLEELQGVPGIGPRWAIVNGDYLVLDGETTLKVKITVPKRKQASKP